MTRTIGPHTITLHPLPERDWWQVCVVGERRWDVRGKREAERVYRDQCRRLEREVQSCQ